MQDDHGDTVDIAKDIETELEQSNTPDEPESGGCTQEWPSNLGIVPHMDSLADSVFGFGGFDEFLTYSCKYVCIYKF